MLALVFIDSFYSSCWWWCLWNFLHFLHFESQFIYQELSDESSGVSIHMHLLLAYTIQTKTDL